MELKQIKQNIFYILAIIGTSFGVIGTAGWGLILGIRHGDIVTIWGSAIGIGITLFGLGVWSANLIIAIKQYIEVKREQAKIKSLFNSIMGEIDKKQSEKKGGDKKWR